MLWDGNRSIWSTVVDQKLDRTIDVRAVPPLGTSWELSLLTVILVVSPKQKDWVEQLDPTLVELDLRMDWMHA